MIRQQVTYSDMAITYCFLLLVCSSSVFSLPLHNSKEALPKFSVDGQKLRDGDMLYPDGVVEDRQAIPPHYAGIQDCYRWPKGVVKYQRYESMGNSTWDFVQQAMQLWSNLTCVSFEPINGNTDQPYVRMFDPGKRTCYSHVGRVCWKNGHNAYALGKGCWKHIGIPIHELGHVIGLFHQQSRLDRDQWVTIIEENIKGMETENFEKEESWTPDDWNVEYDYCSIMHYHSQQFTRDKGRLTILPKDRSYTKAIGDRSGLSFSDIHVVNNMYQCSAHCPEELTCPERCFLNKHCKCYCPYTLADGTCANYKLGETPLTFEPTASESSRPSPINATSCRKKRVISRFERIKIDSENKLPLTCTYKLTNGMRYKNYTRLHIKITSISILPENSPCVNYVAIRGDNTFNFPSSSIACGRKTNKYGVLEAKSLGDTISMKVHMDGSGNEFSIRGYVSVVRY